MTQPRRPSDDLLLQLIRENRHDAEIGVRMGITTGEVRERKTELRQRLGEERYRRLVAGRPEPRTPFWRRWWFAAGGTALGGFALLLTAANLLAGDAEEIAPPRAIPSVTPVPTVRPASVVTVGDQRFDDAGVFFTLADANGLNFVGSPTNHAGVAVIDLEDTAFVTPSEFARWRLVSTGYREVVLSARLSGREVTVRVTSAHAATRVRTVSEGVGPVARLVSQLDIYSPVVFVRAYDERGRDLTPHVTADGRLHISQQPIPDDWVLEETNGSRVETSSAFEIAAIELKSQGQASTFCEERDEEAFRCLVVLQQVSQVTAVQDGTLACPTAETRTFEAAGFRLSFALGFAINRAGTGPCEPSELRPGQSLLVGQDWEVTAATLDGQPLSVGVTRAGILVVGQFTGDLRCPCIGD